MAIAMIDGSGGRVSVSGEFNTHRMCDFELLVICTGDSLQAPTEKATFTNHGHGAVQSFDHQLATPADALHKAKLIYTYAVTPPTDGSPPNYLLPLKMLQDGARIHNDDKFKGSDPLQQYLSGEVLLRHRNQ